MILRCDSCELSLRAQVPIITDEIFRFYDAANFSARKLTKLMFVWVMMLHMLSSFKGVIQRWDNDPMSTELYGFREYMHSLWWTVTALTSFGTIPTPSSNVQLTYSSGVLVGSFVTSVYIIGANANARVRCARCATCANGVVIWPRSVTFRAPI
jgi:hypothetical protein